MGVLPGRLVLVAVAQPAAARRSLYQEVADHYLTDRPQIFLYHHRWFWGAKGFGPSPDGLIRFAGLRLPR